MYIPEPVVLELDAGRLLRSDTVNPRQLEWATIVVVTDEQMAALPPNRLGPGERSVIAYARTGPNRIAGLDDARARSLAEELGLRAVGTIGVLLLARRSGQIPAVRPLLDAVRACGFHMDAELYHTALRLAGEER
ncbi:MAG: DUF3368 domain-containing protein [Anaerolineae bacterium]|nr:DUF3368 domain-containing protein [Anaerolineae bacterium]